MTWLFEYGWCQILCHTEILACYTQQFAGPILSTGKRIPKEAACVAKQDACMGRCAPILLTEEGEKVDVVPVASAIALTLIIGVLAFRFYTWRSIRLADQMETEEITKKHN